MEESRVRIANVITAKYSDFLSYCAAAGKIYVSDLSNVDFVAFRTSSGQSREYIKEIKTVLAALIANVKENAIAASSAVENQDGTSKKEALDKDVTIPAAREAEESAEEEHLVETNQDLKENLSEKKNEPENLEICALPDSHTSMEFVSEKQSNYDLAQDTNGKDNDLDTILRERSGEPLADIYGVKASLFDEVNISDLFLGVRSYNCLSHSNINFVGEVLTKTTLELQEIKNMGRKSVAEILHKVKDYVSNPENLESASVQSIKKGERENHRIDLNSGFKEIVESLLSGKEYSTEGLSEKQLLQIESIKDAITIAGEEICLKAYLAPNQMGEVCGALFRFCSPYILFHESVVEGIQTVRQLPVEVRKLKAVPFIEAFSAKYGDKLQLLSSKCNDNTTVAYIPYLYEKIRQEKNAENAILAANRFLRWLDFDLSTIVERILDGFHTMMNTRLNSRKDRVWEIYTLRGKGETLDAIGARYGVTRERVRQIEQKVQRNFWYVFQNQQYDIIMLVYASLNGKKVLSYNDLSNLVGSEFSELLWGYIRHDQVHEHYYYSPSLDVIIIISGTSTSFNEASLYRKINKFFSSLPEIIEVSQKKTILMSFENKTTIPLELAEIEFQRRYRQTGIFYCKGRLTVPFMCEYVLKHRFPGGFKIADEYEAGRFKEYLVEFFGDLASSITYRAIDTKVAEVGFLCDRGKYIHPDVIQIAPSVIKSINNYLEKWPRAVISYGEAFTGVKEIIQGTQITNKYLLQGALKKYGCRFYTGRDYIRKTMSISILDEIEAFVAARGVVNKAEILAEFTALSEANLTQIIARSSNVFSLDNGFYLHVNQFDIQPSDYKDLRSYLADACKEIPVNIRVVQNDVAVKFPEFMFRNDFDDRNKLFAALNYMFIEEFSFSRPYIGNRGVSDISNRSVILQHIEDYENIEIEELIDICEENGIHYASLSYLCQLISPDYYRISQTSLMKPEVAGITNEIVMAAAGYILELLNSRDYIVGLNVSDYLWLPQLDIDWNPFLLESLVVQSQKVHVINMTGDSYKHPNAIYISEKYQDETIDSLVVKILTEKVRKGMFVSKNEMREWLREEGLIEGKLPRFLELDKYFYTDDTGVHCVGE